MKTKWLICLFPCFFLVGCFSPDRSSPSERPVEPEVAEESVTPQVSREALLTYGEETPARLSLGLGGEPVLIAGGYLRLLGIVNGKNALALLELAGRGVALSFGESIAGYRLEKIFGNEVSLVREK